MFHDCTYFSNHQVGEQPTTPLRWRGHGYSYIKEATNELHGKWDFLKGSFLTFTIQCLGRAQYRNMYIIHILIANDGCFKGFPAILRVLEDMLFFGRIFYFSILERNICGWRVTLFWWALQVAVSGQTSGGWCGLLGGHCVTWGRNRQKAKYEAQKTVNLYGLLSKPFASGCKLKLSAVHCWCHGQ